MNPPRIIPPCSQRVLKSTKSASMTDFFWCDFRISRNARFDLTRNQNSLQQHAKKHRGRNELMPAALTTTTPGR